MTDGKLAETDEISLFSLGTALLRSRWRIGRWMFIGGVIAAAAGLRRPNLYVASTSFAPQGNDAGRSGLASLAGQFGVALPAQNETLSPDFYVQLLRSRVVLQRVARDTFTVPELGGRKLSFLDLFKVPGAGAADREGEGIKLLATIVGSSVTKTTGVVHLTVTTRWPSVSLAIATDLVSAVNEFNQQTRQGQATAERKFIESRLDLAAADLRAAENRLQQFLLTNRQGMGSPELAFEHDRLQRDVTLKQGVFTSLTQDYEEVRLREVRDTPVITIIEPPAVPTRPEPRGRLRSVVIGLVLGGVIGALLSFISALMRHMRTSGNPAADEFIGVLHEAISGIRHPIRALRGLGAR